MINRVFKAGFINTDWASNRNQSETDFSLRLFLEIQHEKVGIYPRFRVERNKIFTVECCYAFFAASIAIYLERFREK
jgi:hypothetical protein